MLDPGYSILDTRSLMVHPASSIKNPESRIQYQKKDPSSGEEPSTLLSTKKLPVHCYVSCNIVDSHCNGSVARSIAIIHTYRFSAGYKYFLSLCCHIYIFRQNTCSSENQFF